MITSKSYAGLIRLGRCIVVDHTEIMYAWLFFHRSEERRVGKEC